MIDSTSLFYFQNVINLKEEITGNQVEFEENKKGCLLIDGENFIIII